jgi:tRNA pseudouridine38-40 synthase
MTMRGTVRYDGTDFAGWQVQPGQRTVQGELENVLARIAGAPVRIAGAGRTDAGVHALGQVFSFRWPAARDWNRLSRSLSSMVGPDFRVERLEEAPAQFHARKSAVGKRYAYSFAQARLPDPLSVRYAWSMGWDLDMEVLRECARRIEGEHDFAGFQGGQGTAKSTVRRIKRVELLEGAVIGPVDAADHWRLEFSGNGFLFHMVRNLVGTMVDVARGYLDMGELDRRLNGAGPFKGHSAPAHGLTLMEVRYGE